MNESVRDPAFDTLLSLDGEILFIEESGVWWVKFMVRRVPVSRERPHGLAYSMTLHGPSGERYVGFDNAHPVSAGTGPGARRPVAHDHCHRLRNVKPYDYTDAASLLADFWSEVDDVLQHLGVKR